MFQPVFRRTIHCEQSDFCDKVSHKMQIHPPVSHEYEEKVKSTKLIEWPNMQNHSPRMFANTNKAYASAKHSKIR